MSWNNTTKREPHPRRKCGTRTFEFTRPNLICVKPPRTELHFLRRLPRRTERWRTVFPSLRGRGVRRRAQWPRPRSTDWRRRSPWSERKPNLATSRRSADSLNVTNNDGRRGLEWPDPRRPCLLRRFDESKALYNGEHWVRSCAYNTAMRSASS